MISVFTDVSSFREGPDGQKLPRAEALLVPLTNTQVDSIQLQINTNLTEEEYPPEPLGYKAWTLLVLRLIRTNQDLRGQIARAKRELGVE